MKILRHICTATVGLGLFCAATPSVTAALRFEVSLTPGLATNALKIAYLTASHDMEVRFGTLQQCVRAAVAGRWPA